MGLHKMSLNKKYQTIEPLSLTSCLLLIFESKRYSMCNYVDEDDGNQHWSGHNRACVESLAKISKV